MNIIKHWANTQVCQTVKSLFTAVNIVTYLSYLSVALFRNGCLNPHWFLSEGFSMTSCGVGKPNAGYVERGHMIGYTELPCPLSGRYLWQQQHRIHTITAALLQVCMCICVWVFVLSWCLRLVLKLQLILKSLWRQQQSFALTWNPVLYVRRRGLNGWQFIPLWRHNYVACQVDWPRTGSLSHIVTTKRNKSPFIVLWLSLTHWPVFPLSLTRPRVIDELLFFTGHEINRPTVSGSTS